jgi:putative ABC transport system ATP-binding protein
MLKLRGVRKSFGAARSRIVLRDIDFDLAGGEYVAIMGESGVGKSTLLNLIAGIDSADAGTISIGEVDLTRLDDDARTLLRRRDIGFVFQAFHLLAHLTIAQNVALPLALLGIARAQAAAQVEDMLAAVGLADRAPSYPRELSGGEAQRVALARALVHRPKLLLADEPTGNLDPDNAAVVLQLLRERVRAQGCAAILVTHSLIAAASAQRRHVLTASGIEPLELE